MIDDAFGDRPDPAQVLADFDRWLHKVANSLLKFEEDRHEDLVQEGRVAIWKALETWDPAKGALPSWVTRAAEARMRDVAWGKGQPLGRPETRGSREVDLGPSLDALESQDALLGHVEDAYHDGEILDAIRSLPRAQQEYVFLRFWGGLEPSSRVPGLQGIIRQFPVLRERWHWQRAKVVLEERLRHLAS